MPQEWAGHHISIHSSELTNMWSTPMQFGAEEARDESISEIICHVTFTWHNHNWSPCSQSVYSTIFRHPTSRDKPLLLLFWVYRQNRGIPSNCSSKLIYVNNIIPCGSKYWHNDICIRVQNDSTNQYEDLTHALYDNIMTTRKSTSWIRISPGNN